MLPAKRLLFIFLVLVLSGALLLCLPGMTVAGIRFEDALFTATSAVCVTGLMVLDIQRDFTFAGQVTILLLIQIGAIGIIALASLIILGGGGRLSIGYEDLVSSSIGGPNLNARALTLAVVRLTLLIEALGTLALFVCWPGASDDWLARLWVCLFHSIAAFCNAGIALYANNLENFSGAYGVNLVLMALVVLGGFGFVNLQELITHSRHRTLRWPRFSVLLKVSLTLTALFILVGALSLLALEHDVGLAGLAWPEKILAAFFQSVSTRTAGFNTVPLASFTDLSLLIMAILMFCGGISGSTAGGIKLNTLAVLFATVRSYIDNFSDISLYNRRLPVTVFQSAVIILFASLLALMTGLILLCLAEGQLVSHARSNNDIIALLFETVSALGTVGLSTGLTAQLTPASKLVLIVLMFIGRLGPLAIIAALATRSKPKPFTNPEAYLPVG